MIRMGKVGLILIVMVQIATGANYDDYLAQWGLEEFDFGQGLVFNGIYTLKIGLNIYDDLPPIENSLNCSKYRKETSSEPLLTSTRKKREIVLEEGLIIDKELLCRYNENLNGTAEASRKEESDWQTLVDPTKSVENIYCDDGLSENCILRVLHMPESTFYWKKRYNVKLRKFVLEESAIIHNPPLKIPIVKEISYRSKTMVEEAKENKNLEISYQCLTNPYFGTVSEQPKLTDFMIRIKRDRQQLLDSNFGRSHFQIFNHGQAEPIAVQTKARIVKKRNKLKLKVPDHIVGQQFLDFSHHESTIDLNFEELKRVENKIEAEVKRVDAEPILNSETRPIAKLCQNWFEIRDNLVGNYTALTKILGRGDPTIDELDLKYSEDFALTCANAAFLIKRNNALAFIDRALVDENNKKLLSLLKINYEINQNDRYRINSKIQKFQKISHLDSIKFALVLSEQKRIEYLGKIKELEALLVDLTETSRSQDDSIKDIKSEISRLVSQMKISEANKLQTEKNIKTLITNRDEFSKKFTEAEKKRYALFYGDVKKVNGKFELVINDTHKASLLNMTDESKSLLDEVKKAEKLLKEFEALVIMQANLIASDEELVRNQKIRLESYESNYTSNVNMAEKIQLEIQKKQKEIDNLNNNFKTQIDLINKEKREVQDQLMETKSGKATVENERDLLKIEIDGYKNANVTQNDLAQWKTSTDSKILEFKNDLNITKISVTNLKQNLDDSKTELDGKISTNIGKIGTLRNEVETLKRVKRQFSESMREAIESHCTQVNSELERLNQEINKERKTVNEGLSKKKRGIAQFLTAGSAQWVTQGVLAASVGANYALDASEWSVRKTADAQLDFKLNKSYTEFLEFAKETRSMQSKEMNIIKQLDTNLYNVNAHLANQTNEFKTLVDKLQHMKTYEADTRLWVYFLMDVQTVQRSVTSYLQQLMKRTRLMESLEFLRTGYIPKDIINSKILESYLRGIANDLPKHLKLAFPIPDKLDLYFQHPLASLVIENKEPTIIISVPTIDQSATIKWFQLVKVLSHPFRCWDERHCKRDETFELNLKENVVFFDQKQPSFSAKFSSLECFGKFDRKVCWLTNRKDNLVLEDCLSDLYNQRNESIKCRVEETNKPVSIVKSGLKSFYHSTTNKLGLTVIDKYEKDVKLENKSWTIYDFLGEQVNLTNLVFKNYKFDEQEGLKLRAQVDNLQEWIGNSSDKLANRTLEQFTKEAIADFLASQVNDEDVFLWTLLKILPILLACAVLIINDHFFVFGVLSVVSRFRGANALETTATELAKTAATKVAKSCPLWNPYCLLKKLLNAIIGPLRNSVWPIMRYFVLLILVLLVAILIAYILYSMIHKHKVINYFYGRVYLPALRKEQGQRWCILATTYLHKRTFINKVYEVVTIEIETNLPVKAEVCSPSSKLCWNVTSFDLQLLGQIEVEYTESNAIVTQKKFETEFDTDLIVWKDQQVPCLEILHGQMADIKLVKLFKN